MHRPLRPPDEARRLEALRRYDLLDTLPEQGLDDLTALAGHICDAPVSLISLVDEQRQWFKSKIGLSISETPREVSFSGHVITQPDLFIVPDAAQDERFADNPLVTGDPHIRFYAGAPLVTAAGQAIGTLCVIDRVPRQLTPSQQDALRVLSRQVMAQLELRRQTRELVESETRLFQVFRNCPVGITIHRWSDRTFVDVNATFTSLAGWTREEVIGHTTEEIRLVDAEAVRVLRSRLEMSARVRDLELSIRTRTGEIRQVILGTELIELGREQHVITTFVDITARKEAETSARQLAAIVESSDAAIVGKDLHGVITSWNRGAEATFGFTAGEMVGTSISRLIPEDRRGEEDRILDAIKRGEHLEHFETRRQTKDGRLIDVAITASAIQGDHGTVVGVSNVARDITERKEAEHAQREQEARYRTLFENAPDGIVIADRESYYLDANASMCRMLGYSRDEFIGLHASDIVTHTEVQHIGSALRVITSAEDYHREWQFRRKDGSVFAADVIATTMPDGNLLGMIRDVTERNRAVEAVLVAEERMRFALQSADVGIWDMDYTTGVLRWSETIEAHYGLQPGTFGGTLEAFVERIHPDDRASVLETVGKAMKAGADFSVLNRSIWPDGTVRWLSGAGRILLGEHGEPVRGVGISQDVTERRTLEEQFQQAQKMDAIGRLAGGVAHDFNNLLTVILGFCELLLADLDPDDLRQADIAEIQKAGTSAAGLTRQLLAFSRKQIIEPTLLDLNVVVTDMRVMLGRLIGEDVNVVLGLRPGLALVKADRGQVEQIVVNLAVNARDAMPTGGTLTIETANVELDENYPKTHFAVTPGPHVVLTVTDTGTGMTPQVQARLFEPFFTTKEVGHGTGLGLATVHGIVMRSGGNVNVYSEVGKGTSFNVYFPRADAAEMAVDAPVPVARPRAGNETVLVVEDAHGLRELTRKLLQRQGYTVLVAANADEALRVFEGHASIDVLLTDVVMPGASGVELTRGLLGRRAALKVIYMSGYTEEAIVHHGVLDPGIAFLHKPFTSEALGRKIREVLDR